MSLNYASMLKAVADRLAGDSTIIAATGVADTSDDLPMIYVERAPSSIADDLVGSARNGYIVVTLVAGTPSDQFGKNARQYDFDVHLFQPYKRDVTPGGEGPGSDMFAALDAVRTRLDSWTPTVSGASFTAVQHEQLTTAHEDDVWHWIQSFTVWMRDES